MPGSLKPLGGRVLEAGPRDRVKLQPCTKDLPVRGNWRLTFLPEPLQAFSLHAPSPHPTPAGLLVKPEWQESSFSATLQQFPAHLSCFAALHCSSVHNWTFTESSVWPISMGLNRHLCLLWWRSWPGEQTHPDLLHLLTGGPLF